MKSLGEARERWYKLFERVLITIGLIVFLSLAAIAGCVYGGYEEARYKKRMEEVEIYTRLWTAEDVGIDMEEFNKIHGEIKCPEETLIIKTNVIY